MMKIEITAEAGKMRATLDEAMATLGYLRSAERALIGEAMLGTSLSSHDDGEFRGDVDAVRDWAGVSTEQASAVTGDQAKRERGKPGPGRQRRTKEEMAEDAAADARDAAAGNVVSGDTRQISADPENRVGPQDSAEVRAQDAADERAESEANKKGLSLDDVRDAVGRYYAKYGMGPATADIQQIFGCKLHEIPESQDAYAKAVAAVDQATADNPFGRTPISVAASAAPAATLDDLKVVMGRYMKTFGDSEGLVDLPKVLGVERITLLPADPAVYAAKIRDVEAALEGNPFGRKVLA